MAKPKGMTNDAVYVRLNQVAARLNRDFGLTGENEIGARTPYDWWKRDKSGSIDPPFPPPVIQGRYPVWIYSRVRDWYKRFKRIERVGVGIEVDDADEPAEPAESA